jgi:hypothetical protein
MELRFYDIIRFITVFQFLFFSLFLLSHKKGNKTSNKLFGLFLFLKALCFSNGLFFRYKVSVISFSPHLFYWGESAEFLLGPLLYLYTISLAYRNFKLKPNHLFHLIPFAIHLTFYSFRFHRYDAETKIDLLSQYLLSMNEYIINHSAIYVHFLVYTLAILFVIYRYNNALKENFASIEKLKLSWLKLLISGFIVLWGTAFIHFILRLNKIYIFYPWALSVFYFLYLQI